MSKHVHNWLQAYHDEQLSGLRKQMVEAHLDECAECRAELEMMQTLSSLLTEAPPAVTVTSPERFATEVNLRLPRSSPKASRARSNGVGWQVTSWGLLLVWAFTQTAAILVMALLAFDWLIPGASLPSILGASGLFDRVSGTWLNAGELLLCSANGSSMFGWCAMIQYLWPLLPSLLYVGWLAIWWANRTHQDNQNTADQPV